MAKLKEKHKDSVLYIGNKGKTDKVLLSGLSQKELNDLAGKKGFEHLFEEPKKSVSNVKEDK